MQEFPPTETAPSNVLVLALSGQRAEARQSLRQTLEGALGRHIECARASAVARLLEAAVLLEDHEVASSLSATLSRLAPVSMLRFAFTTPARILGAASALLNKPDEARAYYHQALVACAKIRFRPEIALSRLQLAELLFDRYPDERAEAIEHLGFAIPEFTEMKMQPALDRALALQQSLKN